MKSFNDGEYSKFGFPIKNVTEKDKLYIIKQLTEYLMSENVSRLQSYERTTPQEIQKIPQKICETYLEIKITKRV